MSTDKMIFRDPTGAKASPQKPDRELTDRRTHNTIQATDTKSTGAERNTRALREAQGMHEDVWKLMRVHAYEGE